VAHSPAGAGGLVGRRAVGTAGRHGQHRGTVEEVAGTAESWNLASKHDKTSRRSPSEFHSKWHSLGVPTHQNAYRIVGLSVCVTLQCPVHLKASQVLAYCAAGADLRLNSPQPYTSLHRETPRSRGLCIAWCVCLLTIR